MNTKIERNKAGRCWQWSVTDNAGNLLAGGYCRTKRDAVHDAGIWTASRRATL